MKIGFSFGARELGPTLATLIVLIFAAGCPSAPSVYTPTPVPLTLTVVTANMANAFSSRDVFGDVTWEERADRFADLITANGLMPDIVSMTESTGWIYCGSDTSGDYDVVDRLIHEMKQRTGITYRVAYMVGAWGVLGARRGSCEYFSGDTVLYNPQRLVNVTPADVAGRFQVAHDASSVYGPLVRRSLPLCHRGTTLEQLDLLIDGPPQVDKCGRATPSGPAWVLLVKLRNGSDDTAASMARFSPVGAAGSSFDVFTIHPQNDEEGRLKVPIDDFVGGLTRAPFRTTAPYYPTIVLGDFNLLNARQLKDDSQPTWPTGTDPVYQPTSDVMQVSLGNGSAPLPALHPLKLDLGLTLPTIEPCRPATGFYPDKSFSDHCGLFVRLTQ